MRRIGRWMLNALTALSLLLCVTAAVFWAITSRTGASITWYGSRARDGLFHGYGVSTVAGEVDFTVEFQNGSFVPDDRLDHFWLARWDWDGRSIEPVWSFAGFTFEHLDSGRDPDPQLNWHGWSSIIVPSWFAVIGTAVLPACWVRRRIRNRVRGRRGFCPRCSYDLTGNVSGVCPECGVKIGRPTA
jgi:hypothetical protein